MTQMNNDPLRDLIRSTLSFYERFGWQPLTNDAIRVFEEEVREVTEAAQDGTDKNHIAEEAADVIVTLIGVCQAAGVTPDQLIEQLHVVVAKNDAKNHDTHVYTDGKIRRRFPKTQTP
jgi:NTP pyrophosphatase (non-canonical NTP hydrolase)